MEVTKIYFAKEGRDFILEKDGAGVYLEVAKRCMFHTKFHTIAHKYCDINQVDLLEILKNLDSYNWDEKKDVNSIQKKSLQCKQYHCEEFD